jgi:hypothetical protein
MSPGVPPDASSSWGVLPSRPLTPVPLSPRELRDRVAHGSLDSGDFLLLDESEDRGLVVKWLPFLRCAARRRMKNDFDTFLRYLGEDGVVVSDPDE